MFTFDGTRSPRVAHATANVRQRCDKQHTKHGSTLAMPALFQTSDKPEVGFTGHVGIIGE